MKDAYPLPRMAGWRWFTTLDMASGYWQVEMSEEDRPKTAFAMRYSLFEWNLMPFGLCNAPATFQRLMEKVMVGLQWRILALYLDDVVVFADTVSRHVDQLGQVWDRCQRAGLKLKPRKCQLLRTSVAFLSHVIDTEGVHTDLNKVQRIQKCSVFCRIDKTTLQWCLVIPDTYQGEILRVLHSAPSTGHFGEARSLAALVRMPVFWFQHRQ